MGRPRKSDPRLEEDPPGYRLREGKKAVSYYHRFRLNGSQEHETITSDYGAEDSLANARAKAWADYDAFMRSKELGNLDDRHEHIAASKQPVPQAFVEFYEANEPIWSKDYAGTVRSQMNKRIEPFFAELMVGQIRSREVVRFRNWMMDPANGYGKPASQGGYGLDTVRSAMAVFSSFCTYLVKDNNRLPNNPCLGVAVADKEHVSDPEGKRDPLTPLQLEQISYAFRLLTFRRGGGRQGNHGEPRPIGETAVWKHRIVLYLLAYVGIRPGDISRALWKNVIDEDTGYFKSHMTVLNAKTASGRKPRELFPPIVEALAIYYNFCGRPPLDQPIVLGPLNGRFNIRNWLKRVWQPVLPLAKIRKYRVPYAARHSAASNLALASGWDPNSITDQMGQSVPTFTIMAYTKSFRDGGTRRHLPIEQVIQEARVKVFGQDFSALLATTNSWYRANGNMPDLPLDRTGHQADAGAEAA